MIYIILFLEGIITFISPCLLPMLPVYVSYFMGTDEGKNRALPNAIGFVLGFTVVFVLMGAFAGGIGRLLIAYGRWFNLATGLVVVVFGLHFLGLFSLPFYKCNINIKVLGFKSSVLFGLVFSVAWTPCVGAFLGTALAQASGQGSVMVGMGMLSAFSLGLGLPYIICAVLTEQLKSAFYFIKKHYRVINYISGGLLVTVGILMMTGVFGRFLSILILILN